MLLCLLGLRCKLSIATDLHPPAVPGLLEPPAVDKVTHHSVELSWRPPDHTPSAGRLHYCVQEKEKGREFTNVYK